MPALYVSSALLVKLDCIGFAADLLTSLFAVFVVIDPPHSGPWRALKESARILRGSRWLWHSTFLNSAYIVGLNLEFSPPKQALSRTA